MKITVYGAGYVGLVTAACFADVGNDVLCVDIDADKVDALARGELPYYEPGLSDLVRHCVSQGKLNFSSDPKAGVSHGFYQIIAVGTPSLASGQADTRAIQAVSENIGTHLEDYAVVILKSTAPVGTTEQVQAWVQAALNERGATIAFNVASNPEFLKEGSAIDDFRKPDRIIIGVSHAACAEHLSSLYTPFNRNRDRLHVLDIRSSELSKYAANALLATKISFMNEMSQLAEKMGADIEQVRQAIGADPRIGYEFIYPGCGFGGSCFPKDLLALQGMAESHEFKCDIITAVSDVNERQKLHLFEKILNFYDGHIAGKCIAIWGLSFKPNTDDIRAAPSLTILSKLLEAGVTVQAYDPMARDNIAQHFKQHPNLILCEYAHTTLEGADALTILTEWREFRSPNFEQLKASLRDQVIFDGRNLYDIDTVIGAGLRYECVGRGASL